MQVTIKYKARMSWVDHAAGVHHEDELCNVVHIVDRDSLRTISLKWWSVADPTVEVTT